MKKYEQLYSELEQIVIKLQKEDVEIDKAIELFKKGIVLKNQCDEILKNANDEVVKIIEKETNE